MDFIWKSLILVIAGIVLLRFAGRKAISQLTISTTVVMIAVGSIIVQPIVQKSVWKTMVATGIFVAVLIIVEYLEVNFDFMEKIVTGRAVTVIEDGKIKTENLKKMRFTVDKLEVRLRQKGITKITDVKNATLEPNGQLGYELFYDAQPLTIGEFKKMINFLSPQVQSASPNKDFTLLDEVRINKHKPDIADKLL